MLERELREFPKFQLSLKGITKVTDRFGYYLFLEVNKGTEELIQLHSRLYKNELRRFDLGYEYHPHMTIGKLDSQLELEQAYNKVAGINEQFDTIVDCISIEEIGDQGESNIILEYELK